MRYFAILSALTVSLASATAGCFTNADGGCSEGDTNPCTCTGGPAGTRLCDVQGNFGDCACGGADGGPADGGGQDGGSEGCSPGFQLCTGLCLDTGNDPRACGGCNTQCAPGEVCLQGSCQAGGDCRQDSCQGATFCDQTTGLCMPGCTSNTQCPPGEYCELGAHVCDCAPGSERCGLGCHDTQVDSLNCGGCSQACPAQSSCVDGSCTCQAPTVDCGSQCANLDTDPNHCGNCAKACDPRASCDQGRCLCPGAETDCNGQCSNLLTDPLNCGQCGRTCGTGEACDNGNCKAPPDCRVDGCTGLAWCDTQTGQCQPGCDRDGQCSSGETCDLGSHSCLCPGPTVSCAGSCTDLATDAANCGSCANVCGAGQACRASRCFDPSLACLSYDSGNRLSTCQVASDCTGDMECTAGLLGGSCLDETPCGTTPTAPCCGNGEFCGGIGSLFGTSGTVCCVPGEAIPDGLGGAVCKDTGLTIGCVQDSDCPSAWGRGHCNSVVTPSVCAACTQDSHCNNGQRCELSLGSCVDCLNNTDCSSPTPVCDQSSHSCVSCRNDSDCPGNAPACDTGAGECVACTSKLYCAAPTPACDSSTKSCVECTKKADCAAPTPFCDSTSNSCQACATDNDCPSSAPLCEVGSCVLCPGGTSCQAMQSGRNACYGPPSIAFPCSLDSDCFLLGAGTICDAPTGQQRYCFYSCP